MDETAVTLPFADGEYTFFLPLIRIAAFKREAGCSIFELFNWLGDHLGKLGEETVLVGPSPADPEQCIHLIRNALIGGGVDAAEAKKIVDQYCFPARAAIRDMKLGWDILQAAIYGVRVVSKKKTKNPPTGQTRSRRGD